MHKFFCKLQDCDMITWCKSFEKFQKTKKKECQGNSNKEKTGTVPAKQQKNRNSNSETG